MSTVRSTGFGYGFYIDYKTLESLIPPDLAAQLEEGYVIDEIPELLNLNLIEGSGFGNAWKKYNFVFFAVKSSLVEEYDYFTSKLNIVHPTANELAQLQSLMDFLKVSEEVRDTVGWRAWQYEG